MNCVSVNTKIFSQHFDSAFLSLLNPSTLTFLDLPILLAYSHGVLFLVEASVCRQMQLVRNLKSLE